MCGGPRGSVCRYSHNILYALARLTRLQSVLEPLALAKPSWSGRQRYSKGLAKE